MYGAHVWDGAMGPDLAFLDKYGRADDHGEQYRLTQEVLSYSFGKA